MGNVRREPTTPKSNTYFDPNSLEDLTAAASIYVLHQELAESRENVIRRVYAIIGESVSPIDEYRLRACVEDRVAYHGLVEVGLALFGTRLSDNDKEELENCFGDNKADIDFLLDAIGKHVSPIFTERMSAAASNVVSVPPFSLLADNAAAEHSVIAV